MQKLKQSNEKKNPIRIMYVWMYSSLLCSSFENSKEKGGCLVVVTLYLFLEVYVASIVILRVVYKWMIIWVGLTQYQNNW